MNAHAAAELLKHLRRQVDLVAPAANTETIVTQAENMVVGLTQAERDLAATFYVIHLLKERHRGKVLTAERAASKRRGRFEDSIPADDPYWTARAESEQRHHANLRAIMDDYTAHVKMQWTRELLASTFALPDGTLVTWGAATVEQHELRRDMLMRNAGANLEAAARHEQAIADLGSDGDTLDELAARVAA